MTAFEQREKGFEARFAKDEEAKFVARARQNRLIGLWAAKKMRMGREDAETYARAVVRADLDTVGHDDVVAMIVDDLSRRGISTSEREVRAELERLHPRAEQRDSSRV